MKLSKFNEIGRSMVEMLGVLAIIGVLSVGAIAGYSKAMMKYKLNKQTEQIGFIVDYIIANKEKLRRPIGDTDAKNYYMIPLLKKLGVIPTEMINKNDTEYIYDVFNTKILMENHTDIPSGYAIKFFIDDSNLSVEICRNLYVLSKERAQDISFLYSQRTEQDDSITSTTRYYGDNKYPGATVDRLREMTMVDIDNACRVCDDTKGCYFFITIGYKYG